MLNYIGHFRNFVYGFIVVTKYEMKTVLIFLNGYVICPSVSIVTSTIYTLFSSMW